MIRIKTALLQGIINLLDYGLDPEDATNAPRMHVEDGILRVELANRPLLW